MGLSREMEYHADTIASLVAGKKNMISALRRLEFCDIAFNHTLESLNDLAKENQISENINDHTEPPLPVFRLPDRRTARGPGHHQFHHRTWRVGGRDHPLRRTIHFHARKRFRHLPQPRQVRN